MSNEGFQTNQPKFYNPLPLVEVVLLELEEDLFVEAFLLLEFEATAFLAPPLLLLLVLLL